MKKILNPKQLFLEDKAGLGRYNLVFGSLFSI